MEIWLWIGFIIFVLGMLALDLGVLHRKAAVIGTREALLWSTFCAVLAMTFAGVVYAMYEQHWLNLGLHGDKPLSGKQAALEFISGWLVEQSLSLDNIFVIALIFAYFKVPAENQHRVLFWGILGALIMRGIMIGAGSALILSFDWVTYLFGGLLLLTAVKMLVTREESLEPDKNPLVRLARRFYPVTGHFVGERFFARLESGRMAMTPLFVVLLVVESTDVLFAVDSIPAVFGVTREPFLVFTSNVFAILNLRSLYFALAGVMDKFRYLKISLVFVLAFVGIKMLLPHSIHIPIEASLGIIAGILIVGVLASIWASRRDKSSMDALHG